MKRLALRKGGTIPQIYTLDYRKKQLALQHLDLGPLSLVLCFDCPSYFSVASLLRSWMGNRTSKPDTRLSYVLRNFDKPIPL